MKIDKFIILGYSVERWKDSNGWNFEVTDSRGDLVLWRNGTTKKPSHAKILNYILNIQ